MNEFDPRSKDQNEYCGGQRCSLPRQHTIMDYNFSFLQPRNSAHWKKSLSDLEHWLTL